MSDSIIHDACDELNIVHLPNNDTDGLGLDDGNDVHRFPVANACRQHGKAWYETEKCMKRPESTYDCEKQMTTDEMRDVEAKGVSRGRWAGAPMPFYCGPKTVVGETGERCVVSTTPGRYVF